MDTDLDPDDAIGRRLGALRTWQPAAPADDAWRGVERRRGRRRARRYAFAAVAVLITAAASIAAVANLRPSDRTIVVTPPRQDPPIVRALTPAPVVDNITVVPPGPYRAGQTVSVRVGRSDTFQLEDPYNSNVSVCFPYRGGETCDAAVASRLARGPFHPGSGIFDLELPGWVHTPTGLQPCAELGCRLEITNDGEHFVGTAPLTIDSGPKPGELVRLNGVHRDESLVSLHVDALHPDPSWTSLDPVLRAKLPPGGMSICAFAERLLCDALVQPDPPPFDGAPHDLTIETNRLLLTPQGWIDCVHYVCAIVITRTINAEEGDGGVGSSTEIIAIVPYQLPATTPVMERPSLTIDRAGPFPRDVTMVTVTLHYPPPNVDLERLQLGQCAADRLDLAMDCGYRFDPWTRSADGSLRKQWTISDCTDPRGCYLAVTPAAKGYPEVARTERFAVTR